MNDRAYLDDAAKPDLQKSINTGIKQRTGIVKSEAWLPPLRLTYSRKNKLI